MKSITKLTATLFTVATLAVGLAWAQPGGGATTEWEHGSWFVANLGVDVPCKGEQMDFTGEVPYKIHRVWKPKGGYTQKLQILPITPGSPQFTAVGQTSGKVYYYQNGLPYNEIIQLGPNEVMGGQAREMYEADDGERLIVRFQWRVVATPSGEVVQDRFLFEFECPN